MLGTFRSETRVAENKAARMSFAARSRASSHLLGGLNSMGETQTSSMGPELTELEKQERNWDKQVVGKAWDAYATLRFNAEKARIRNQLLQNVSTFMHVFVALMACLTITQEVHLEDGVQATYDAQGDPYNGATLLDNWSVKNSLLGNMHDSIWAWFRRRRVIK